MPEQLEAEDALARRIVAAAQDGSGEPVQVDEETDGQASEEFAHAAVPDFPYKHCHRRTEFGWCHRRVDHDGDCSPSGDPVADGAVRVEHEGSQDAGC